MSDGARDLLTRGIASAKAGEAELARNYLDRALTMDPSARQKADAHYWLAQLAEDPEQRRQQLELVLFTEPTHFAARRDLAILDGQLDAARVIDPTTEPRPSPPTEAAIDLNRFACPQCGGRMAYDPRHHQLTCSYCGHQAHLAELLEQGTAVGESDFIEVLVTAKGHVRPSATPTFGCKACGATYLIAPDTVSLTCAHCAAAYVIDHSDTQDLVPPQGIVKMGIGEQQAERAFRGWLAEHGLAEAGQLARPRPVFLPAWTFDLTGQAPYRYLRRKGDEWVSESGNQLILYNDLPVAASQRLPKSLAEVVRSFDLSTMTTYDPSHLAGWPAETYQIPAADAAMAARWYAVEQARARVASLLFGSIKDLQLDSAKLLVAAYRLILLPVWRTSYVIEGKPYQAVINGQNASLVAEKPAGGLAGFFRRILGG